MKKRILSILLVFCMIFSMMPVSAFAAETEEPHDHGADTLAATQTIYFENSSGMYGAEPKICYWRDEAGDMGSYYPGDNMLPAGDWLYYCDIPTEARYVLFDDGMGLMTEPLTIPTDGKSLYSLADEKWSFYPPCEHASLGDYSSMSNGIHSATCLRCSESIEENCSYRDDGSCLCGAECPHESFTDGVCAVCGKGCPHESFTDGVCDSCGIMGGYCGAAANEGGEKSIVWTYNEGTDAFAVVGTGAMTDYDSYSSRPWDSISRNVTTLTISEGVTAIGESAFHNFMGLSELTIPSSVETIGYGAFTSCWRVESLTFAEDSCLTTLEVGAFQSCKSLKEVTLPSSLTKISALAFSGCTNLKNIFVEDGSSTFADTDGVLYTADGTTLVLYPAGKEDTEFAIPTGVTTIANSAFEYLQHLKTLIVSDDVKIVEIGAFIQPFKMNLSVPCFWDEEYAVDLFSLEGYEEIVTVIVREHDFDTTGACTACGAECPHESFTDGVCTVCGNVCLHESFTDGVCTVCGIMGGYCGAAANEGGEKSVMWLYYETTGAFTIVGTGAMTDYDSYSSRPWDSISRNVTTMTISEGVTRIGDYAFEYFLGLSELTIPASVESIGYAAFTTFLNVESLTFAEGSRLTTLEAFAFNYFPNLEEFTLPSGLTNLDYDAVSDFPRLKNIFVEEGNSAFAATDGVLYTASGTKLLKYPDAKEDTEFTVPAGVTTIAAWAFGNNRDLKTVTLPAGIKTIEEYAFTINTVTTVHAPCSWDTEKPLYAFDETVSVIVRDHTPDEEIGQTCKGLRCAVCKGWYGEADASKHNDFFYFKIGQSIIASCGYCGFNASKLTLVAPEETVYDGTEKGGVTVEGSVPDVTTPEIVYSGDRVNVTEEGYTASITLGEKTLTLNVKIQPKELTVAELTVSGGYYGDEYISSYDTELEGVLDGDYVYFYPDQVIPESSEIGQYTTVKGIVGGELSGDDAANYRLPENLDTMVLPASDGINGYYTIAPKQAYIMIHDQEVPEGQEIDSNGYSVVDYYTETPIEGFTFSGITLTVNKNDEIEVARDDEWNVIVTVTNADGEDVTDCFEFYASESGKITRTHEGHKLNSDGFCETKADCKLYDTPSYNDGIWAYEITNAGQLYWFANYINNERNDANAILMNDIVIPAGAPAWEPIMNLYGEFDGNFKTVSGLHVSGSENVSMFGGGGYAYGTIKNLHISNSTFTGESYVGALAGYHSGPIENCYVDGTVTVSGDSYVGGLVGSMGSGYVMNCYAYADSLIGSFYSSYTEVTNSYYLSETETEDGGKTAEQFASGEVAYLLQAGQPLEDYWDEDLQEYIPIPGSAPEVWGQTCGQGLPAFGGATVYQGYTDCDLFLDYSNDAGISQVPLPHTGTLEYTPNEDGTTHKGSYDCCGKVVVESEEHDSFDSAIGECKCGAPVAAARIDNVYYKTLDEALAAWTDGKTLVLTNDVSTNDYIWVKEKSVILDLNGNTLSLGNNAIRVGELSYVDEFTKELIWGELTVRDSGSGGAINSDYRSLMIYGTALLESGTLNDTVYVCEGAAMNMTGGKIHAQGSDFGVTNQGELNISGGAISGRFGIINETSGVAAISGTPVITGSDYNAYNPGAAIDNSGTMTISGSPVLTGGSYGELAVYSPITLNTQPAEGELWHIYADGDSVVAAIPGDGVTLDLSKFALVSKMSEDHELCLNADGELVLCKHSGETQTCMGYVCDSCGNFFGEADDTKHSFDSTTGECTVCAMDIAVALIEIESKNEGKTSYYVADLSGLYIFEGYPIDVTVTLLRDCTTTQPIMPSYNGSFTLDTNGYTLTHSNQGALIQIITSKNIAIKLTGNGVIDSASSVTGLITNGSLTIDKEITLINFSGRFRQAGSGVFDLSQANIPESGYKVELNPDREVDVSEILMLPQDYYFMVDGKAVYRVSGLVEGVVLKHTEHSYDSAGVCTVCGVACSHESYTNLVCTVCGSYEPAELVSGYYEIGNASQLYWFAKQVNDGQTTINGKLTANIVVNENVLTTDGALNGDGSGFLPWTPMGNFQNSYTGTFDGNGKTVSGLYVNENINYVGLFGGSAGIVKNVGVVDSYLSGNNTVSGVAAYNKGSVESCYNTGTVSGSYDVGGVVGYNTGSGTVKNSYNTGSVNGGDAGGVASCNEGTVESCYNTGTVSGSDEVGGVVSYNTDSGTVKNSYNTGSVSGSKYVGGMVGWNTGTVESCYNTDSVSGSNYVGGVVGYNSGIVENCYNTGTVSGSWYVGGVAGQVRSGTVTNCYNTGTVSGSYNVGGVVGYNSGIVENSYYNSDVYSGTLIGNGSGTATNVTGKTTEQFKSGEVAYLLGDAFGQTIGTDMHPVLGGAKVYEGYTNCDDVKDYSNDPTISQEKPDHDWSNNDGECTVCGVACEHADQTGETCTVCGASLHTHTPDDDRGQTCKGYWCTSCEEWYGDANSDAHNYVGKVTDEPTCDETGMMTYTCSYCSDSYTEDIPAFHNNNMEYHPAKEPIDCANPGNIEHWYCPGCNESFADAYAEVYLNPWYIELTVDCVRPEDLADCATFICETCGNENWGYGEHDVVACQGGICSKCGDEIEGYGCANYDTPACMDGVCYYCGGFVAGFGHENGAWAPCEDGECAYGCGLLYPATEPHVDEDGDDYCDNCWNHLNHVAPEVYDPCEGYDCLICWAWIEGQHTGGEATCVSGPICEVCRTEYGEADPDAHNFVDGECECGETDGTDSPKPLEIVKQPESVSGALNELVSTSVEVQGEGLQYQWYYRDAGRTKFTKSTYTGDTYSLYMYKSRHGREIYCVITDANGNSVTSDIATLRVAKTEELAVAVQPKSTQAALNSVAIVTVAAEGEGLQYQWFYRDADSEAFTKSVYSNDTYVLYMYQSRDDREVYCVITDTYGDSVITDIVTLSIAEIEQPKFITQPEDTTAALNDMAVVTVEAEGDGLKYQWYYRDAGSKNFRKSIYTGDTYSLYMYKSRNGREVYCTVTDAYGSTVSSNIVTLSIAPKTELQILQQPVSTEALFGALAVTTVEAEGEGLKYQWYYRDAGKEKFIKSIYTGDTYSLYMTAGRDGREIYCIVSDAYGNQERTNTVTLRVSETPEEN